MFEGLFQPTHLFLILMIALILFGPKRLPEIGSALGKAIREVRRGMSASYEANTDDQNKKENSSPNEQK